MILVSLDKNVCYFFKEIFQEPNINIKPICLMTSQLDTDYVYVSILLQGHIISYLCIIKNNLKK